MHWKRTTFVLLVLGLLFFVIWNQVACKGICGVYQKNMSFFIFLVILVFTVIFLYYSLKLWAGAKKKYIEKDKEKKEKTPEKGGK